MRQILPQIAHGIRFADAFFALDFSIAMFFEGEDFWHVFCFKNKSASLVLFRMPTRELSADTVSLLLTGRSGTDIGICKTMLREHHGRAKTSLYSSVVGVLVFGFSLQIINPHLRAALWMLSMAFIFPLEFVIGEWLRPLTSDDESIAAERLWMPLVFATARGLGWGIGGYLFYEELLEYEIILAMILCCVAVFGAALLSTYLGAAILFILCVLTPSICLLLQSQIQFFYVLGFAGIAFAGIAIWFSFLANRLGVKAFKLSVENSNLIEALQSTNSELRNKNEVLNYALEKIEQVAATDELTGCYNRRYMMGTLRQELAISLRDYRPFSLLLIDVDHFKRVNDTHGHVIGDRVLTSIAQVLRETMRGMDTLARFGGEEFACMLPGTTQEEASILAERIRLAVAVQRIDCGAGHLSVTACIGIAQWQPGETIESLIHRADLGLYAAKADGRNRVVLNTSKATDLPQVTGA